MKSLKCKERKGKKFKIADNPTTTTGSQHVLGTESLSLNVTQSIPHGVKRNHINVRNIS